MNSCENLEQIYDYLEFFDILKPKKKISKENGIILQELCL